MWSKPHKGQVKLSKPSSPTSNHQTGNKDSSTYSFCARNIFDEWAAVLICSKCCPAGKKKSFQLCDANLTINADGCQLATSKKTVGSIRHEESWPVNASKPVQRTASLVAHICRGLPRHSSRQHRESWRHQIDWVGIKEMFKYTIKKNTLPWSKYMFNLLYQTTINVTVVCLQDALLCILPENGT